MLCGPTTTIIITCSAKRAHNLLTREVHTVIYLSICGFMATHFCFSGNIIYSAPEFLFAEIYFYVSSLTVRLDIAPTAITVLHAPDFFISVYEYKDQSTFEA